MNFLLHLSPSRHYVPPETPLDGWLEREFPDLDLFVYWHRTAKSWTLAEWMSRDRGVAVEIEALGPSLVPSTEKAATIRKKLRKPDKRSEISKRKDAEEAARIARWREEEAIKQALAEKINRDARPGSAGKSGRIFLPSDMMGG